MRADTLIDQDLIDFYHELADYLDNLTDVDLALVAEEVEENWGGNIGDETKKLMRRFGADKRFGLDWPKEYGGRESPLRQWAFLEVLSYRRLPAGEQGQTLSSLGPAIARLGTPAQKERFLGGILSGEIDFAMAYTEPEAGTDLGSLRTRAEQVEGGYLVNGTKVFISGANRATDLWFAARTGTPESRSRGVSIFVVPIDSPGITIRELRTQSGERSNEVIFQDLFVPEDARIGAENEGWTAIRFQLRLERLFAHGSLRHDLDRLIGYARERGYIDSDVNWRRHLAQLAAEVEVARMFSLRSALMLEAGDVPVAEASMTKVWFSELRQRMALVALDLLGPEGQIGGPDAPMGGRVEHLYRASTVQKFAGGANEIQRDIIAEQALGMTR